jgi:phospholipid transport system substrate-binding protein
MTKNSLNRRGMLRLALLGLAAPGIAALPGVAHAQDRAPDAGAVAPVQQLSNQLLQVMRAGRGTPFQQRYEMLAPAVDQAFDLNTILRTSVGLRWSSLPPAQQQQLQQVFRRYTVATFVANFDNYTGQQIQVAPGTRQVSPTEQIVQTEIVAPGGNPTQLDYVMRNEGGAWKAVDVLADGSISRVAVQRSDFRSLLEDGTGAELVASLNRKVASLSDGALA